jgi:hypothetical protein
MGDGKNANRATADNISQNLKDSIKADLETFGGLTPSNRAASACVSLRFSRILLMTIATRPFRKVSAAVHQMGGRTKFTPPLTVSLMMRAKFGGSAVGASACQIRSSSSAAAIEFP